MLGLIILDIAQFFATGKYFDHAGAKYFHASGTEEFKQGAWEKFRKDAETREQTYDEIESRKTGHTTNTGNTADGDADVAAGSLADTMRGAIP